MLEQEIASIMRFTLDRAGSPTPYYKEVPQDFLVPAVYFPVPEIGSRGDTLSTYALEYSWFIKFFHWDTQTAHDMAFRVFTAMLSARNLVPLIDTDGRPVGKGIRLKDPSMKKIEGASGVVQLSLAWDSPRPYDDTEYQKMMTYDLSMYSRDAFEAAVEDMQKRESGG